jgi:hypothetical protein
MEFLYPAPLSRLESLCAICDKQIRIARLEQFQAKRQSVDEEMRPIKAIDRRHGGREQSMPGNA